MFDTIYFDKAYTCPKCQKRIYSTQTKAFEEIERRGRKRLADFVDVRADKRKVFYYEGFYGSLVADVESNRLVGKIEGIKDEDIIYEGKTVREREDKFREAVSRYRKKT